MDGREGVVGAGKRQMRRNSLGSPSQPHHTPHPATTTTTTTTQAAETGGEDLSADDIRRLAALRRSGGAGTTSPGSSPADAAGGLLAGVLEEARLIEWPTLGRAAGDTAVVLAIVATSAALLFAINYALTELSSLIY